jgi:hypothetical protein
VTLRPALGPWAAALVMAAAGARPAAAQLYPALAQRYLLTTDVRDERAIWVNPAGLARRIQASLAADVSMDRDAGALRVAQYGVSFMSRNLGFGWKRDRYPGGLGASTYAVGAGLGDDVLGAGVLRRWNQGGQGSWDLALRGHATGTIDLSLVWRDVGSPVVRDTVYRSRLVPAVGLRLAGGRFLAGVEEDVAPSLGALGQVRAGATLALGPIVVSVRGAFAGAAAGRGIAIAIGLEGASYRGTLVGLVPSGSGGLQTFGASGALVAAPGRPTRR